MRPPVFYRGPKMYFVCSYTSRSFLHICHYSTGTCTYHVTLSRCTYSHSHVYSLQLYNYRYRYYDADWLSFFGRSRSHPYESPKQQPTKQRVRRESEDFNVGGNTREPVMPLRWRNIGRKGWEIGVSSGKRDLLPVVSRGKRDQAIHGLTLGV